MDKKISFYRGITFILAFNFYTVSSMPVEKNILDVIQFCPTVNFLQKSSYTAECSEIPYPKEFKNEPELAMCMTVNDITNKLCSYFSQVPVTSKENIIQLPKSSEEFDIKLKKEFDINLKEPTQIEYDNFVANFCKNISSTINKLNSLGIKSNKDTVQFIEYVNTTLLVEGECGFTCHRPHNKINPICIVLAWANDLFITLKPLKSSNKVIENLPLKNISIPAHSVQVSKEQPVLDNKQVVQAQHNLEKSDNINKVLATSAPKSSPQKQAVKQESPSNEPKKPDEKTAKTVDTSSKKVEYEAKKDTENPKIENQGKNDPNLHLSPINENANVAASKPVENRVENPNAVQPEDANVENEFTSGEDRQIKKDNENDIEEGNEQENIDNDLKETNINLDDGGVPLGSSDQQDPLPDGKKFYHHSSITKVEDESHFFTYLSFIVIICIGLYVGYHNKQKILAMVLEGRRSRRGRGSRRRPSTASYRKLDCNLEEAVTSQCNSNVTHVIY